MINTCRDENLFQNVCKFFYFSFAYKPSGIVAYSMGPSGVHSAVSAALPLWVEMGSVPVKQFVSIRSVSFHHFLKYSLYVYIYIP